MVIFPKTSGKKKEFYEQKKSKKKEKLALLGINRGPFFLSFAHLINSMLDLNIANFQKQGRKMGDFIQMPV